jgi:ABC-type glycerol-3-phosphate transport system substrate-binding protein
VTLFLSGALIASAGGESDTAASGDEKFDFTWTGLFSVKAVPDNPLEQMIEEQFNVDITIIHLPYNNAEAISLALSSGDYPDVLYTWAPGGMVDWYLKGAFRSIPRSMIEEHAPHYTASMTALGGGAWYYGLVPGTSDEYMGMPNREDGQEGCGYLPQWRLDWLEQAGLAPDMANAQDLAPTGAPGTYMRLLERFEWDDVERIFADFANNDYDGNGRIDSTALQGSGERLSYWRSHGFVFISHGINDVLNYRDPDGSTVMEHNAVRSKESLQVLQRWFQAGYLDSELPAVDKNVTSNKIIAGNAGAWMRSNACGRAAETGKSDLCTQIVNDGGNADAKILTTLTPLSPHGDTRCRQENRALPLNPQQATAFKVGMSDAKLARALQIYDWANYDPQGQVISWFGRPGIDFQWEGAPWASKIIRPEECCSQEWQGERGLLAYNGYVRTNEYSRFTRSAEVTADIALFRDPNSPVNDATKAYREDIFAQTRFEELLSTSRTALDTIRDEFWWKAVTSDIDIEAEWPGYVETLMKNGLRQILAEAEKMPLVSDILAGRVSPP